MKLSRLTKITFMLAIFFFIDKVLAFVRQILIARQFGLSKELDAFNVANNVPDLLFALISGGALAIAFIPVLTQVITRSGQKPAWELFSRIANLAFLVTVILAALVAIFAPVMVRAEIGIAPGFNPDQQNLVIRLMRLNLIATLIFSISGLIMAGLQANQHFLFPAMAPLFYNVGQILGVTILSPEKGYSIGTFTLPAFGMGVQGLVYGVIIGALLHLAIQIPGLVKFNFHWIARIDIRNEDVRKVLHLMGPRLLTMLFIQLIFLIRDNLASRLATGAVTSLTYGWMIQQVPETLIGTAIGTALLPTLSEHFSANEKALFSETIQKAVRVLTALTLPIAATLALGLGPLLNLAFNFGVEGTRLLSWVTAGFLLGLMGHSLKEVGARSFYARQNAIIPLATAGINLALYVVVGSLLYKPLGAVGIAITDSLVFTLEAFLLIALLNHNTVPKITFQSTGFRSILAAMTAGLVTWAAILILTPRVHPLIAGTLPMLLGLASSLPWIRKELILLVKL
ncbi:MAG: murein biosynthesis integral membrane protein MurJ [Chloroflexi bacterium]|nr:murein biosynthesis integral membrane protein MurJ [Chloroflexota bacterium]